MLDNQRVRFRSRYADTLQKTCHLFRFLANHKVWVQERKLIFKTIATPSLQGEIHFRVREPCESAAIQLDHGKVAELVNIRITSDS
jgi:hypothetical protein